MEILKLPVDSWQEYRDLRLQALKEDPQAFGSSYQTNFEYPKEEWQRRLTNAAVGKINWLLFAREKDKLVGMIGAYMEDNSVDMATILSVYVSKKERGKGVSIKLMEGMLEELSGKSFLKKAKLRVNRDQLPAVGLYKKFGFKEVGTEPHKMGDGKLVDVLVMERSLPF